MFSRGRQNVEWSDCAPYVLYIICKLCLDVMSYLHLVQLMCQIVMNNRGQQRKQK